MMDSVSRRVGVLSQHLQAACEERHVGEVELQPLSCSQCGCSGHSAGSDGASTSYASATGRPSSYARVHGEVSRAPAQWRRIDTVAKEELREVRYEKAVGEGIAKVHRSALAVEALRQCSMSTAHLSPCAPPPATVMPALSCAGHHQPPREAQCIHPTHGCGSLAATAWRLASWRVVAMLQASAPLAGSAHLAVAIHPACAVQ